MGVGSGGERMSCCLVGDGSGRRVEGVIPQAKGRLGRDPLGLLNHHASPIWLMKRANNISGVVGGFAVKKRGKKGWARGLLYLGRKLIMRVEKDKTRDKEDESCARLTLDWDASIPANGTTHVGSKNV